MAENGKEAMTIGDCMGKMIEVKIDVNAGIKVSPKQGQMFYVLPVIYQKDGKEKEGNIGFIGEGVIAQVLEKQGDKASKTLQVPESNVVARTSKPNWITAPY